MRREADTTLHEAFLQNEGNEGFALVVNGKRSITAATTVLRNETGSRVIFNREDQSRSTGSLLFQDSCLFAFELLIRQFAGIAQFMQSFQCFQPRYIRG